MGADSKIFFQAKPAAGQVASITVPEGKQWQGIYKCCNQSATEDRVRVAVVPAGGAVEAKRYEEYDTAIPAYGTGRDTLDLGPGDSVHLSSTGGNVSFTLRGLEVS